LKQAPSSFITLLKTTLKQVSQRVVMKSDSEDIDGNIMSTTWVPQHDLLGNIKTRLFISHCGNNVHFKGLYHGVPIICIPLNADQFGIANRITKHGVGLTLDRTTLTAESLLKAVNEILTVNKYRDTMKRASAMFRDRPETPQQRGASAIEHVIKYGGKHLRPYSADMPNYQLMMLDIWVTFFVLVLAVTLTLNYMMYCLCRQLCKQRKLKID
jgi:glucuronosyltransferase